MNRSLDFQILSALPGNRQKTISPSDAEYVALIKGYLNFKEENGNVTIEKDGGPLRDTKTLQPVPMADAINALFTERGWSIPESVSNPAGFTKKSQVIAAFEKDGKNINGAHSIDLVMQLSALKAANPAFDMDN